MGTIEKFDHEKVIVYRNWVPEELFSQVRTALNQQTIRKRFYLLRNPETPVAFQDLNYYIGLRLGIGATALIGKRYDRDQKHISRAYDMHLDPSEWRGQDLVTLTTDGEADMLFVDSAGEDRGIDLQPNTIVRMNPEVMHAVSPPRTDVPRMALFLGRSTLLR